MLWLATSALAVSPELHHLLHADSNNLSHECVLTLLSKGLFAGPASADPQWWPHAPTLRVPPAPDEPVRSRFDYRLSPSRAPPAVSFVRAVVG